MNTIGYINVSLETFGGLLSLIFISCLYITRPQKTRLEHLFIRLLICNTFLLFCDAAAWLFKGRIDSFGFYMVHISNFLVYALGYLMLLLFTHYLISFLRTKDTHITNVTLYVMSGLMLLAVCLVILSQFNNMYYVIDEQNRYHRQDWFWLSQTFGIVGMLLNFGLLLRYRNMMKRKEFWIFITYVCLPVAAMLFQILFYSIAVLYLATTICLLCIYIGIQIALSQESLQKELEMEEAKNAVLLSQIQPHFIYNALVSIKELCDVGEQQTTSKALEHFAYYLRGNLDSLLDTRLIPFLQEVSHVEDYLYLQKIRFKDSLCIVWDLQFTDFLLPPLTLQPIVENAVRHGIREKQDRSILRIHSEEKEKQIIITVTDDGMGFSTENRRNDGRSHVGISNVQSRLQSQCNGSLIIESNLGEGTTVRIILPKKIDEPCKS